MKKCFEESLIKSEAHVPAAKQAAEKLMLFRSRVGSDVVEGSTNDIWQISDGLPYLKTSTPEQQDSFSAACKAALQSLTYGRTKVRPYLKNGLNQSILKESLIEP